MVSCRYIARPLPAITVYDEQVLFPATANKLNILYMIYVKCHLDTDELPFCSFFCYVQ